MNADILTGAMMCHLFRFAFHRHFIIVLHPTNAPKHTVCDHHVSRYSPFLSNCQNGAKAGRSSILVPRNIGTLPRLSFTRSFTTLFVVLCGEGVLRVGGDRGEQEDNL